MYFTNFPWCFCPWWIVEFFRIPNSCVIWPAIQITYSEIFKSTHTEKTFNLFTIAPLSFTSSTSCWFFIWFILLIRRPITNYSLMFWYWGPNRSGNVFFIDWSLIGDHSLGGACKKIRPYGFPYLRLWSILLQKPDNGHS